MFMDPSQNDPYGNVQSTMSNITEDVSAVVETAKTKFGEVAEPAKEKAVEFAEKEKDIGADQIKTVAKAVHGAASQLESEMPQIAGYIHDAGQRLERVADELRQGKVEDLMSKFGDYARDQPAMVFGGAVLAGFALTRFAKSAVHHGPNGLQGAPSPGPGGTA
jgi:hypothetical protein